MKRRPIAAVSISALAGLALLIQPGLASSAFAAQDANSQQIKGQIVNSSVKRDCIAPAGTRVCTFDIAGIALSDDGELIDRQIVGNMHGAGDKSGAAPGAESYNRSYAVWKYPDASTMLMHSEGKAETNADGQRVVSGTKTCIDGTGRFANVDCTIDWSHTPQAGGLKAGSYSGTITPKGQS